MSKVSMSRSLMLAGGGALAMLALSSQQALAVPSFARQTGLPCEVCHTVFPELTPFGRLFKLNGYTLTGLKQIEAAGGKGLKINAGAPLSVMVMTGVTHENKVAAGSQNNNAEFPQQLSLFYAGEISPHMGSFLQVTY
ncbi:MAG: cytochrome C, partial [Pseudomonadota bacterium]|nr:cytochrome C [Pseudomonadota bacterium]